MSATPPNTDPEELKRLFQSGQRLMDDGQKAMTQGKFRDACGSFQESIALFQRTGTPLMVARVNFQLGAAYENMSEWENALQAFHACLRSEADYASKVQLGETYLKIAQIQLNIGKLDEAQENSQAAIDNLESEGQPLTSASALYLKGSIFIIQNDTESAIFYFNLALDHLKTQPEPALIVRVQENLGMAYKRVGKYEESIHAFMIALDLEHTSRNYGSVAAILEQMADNYKILQKKDKCLGFYHDAREIRSKLKSPQNPTFLNRLLMKYAEALLFFKENKKAQDVCEDATAIAEQNNLKEQLVAGLLLNAKILTQSISNAERDVASINQYLDEASNIAEENKFEKLAIRAILQRAILYRYTNQMQKVELILEKANERATNSKEQGILAEVLEQQGILRHTQGKFEGAYELFKEAVKLLEKTQNPSEFNDSKAEVHYNLACAACRLHIAEDTILHLKKAVELDPQYKLIAKTDEDFRPIWEDRPFKDIVG